MAVEYVSNSIQTVALNNAILLNDSIPCRKGLIIHENESGVFILRGITNGQCYATYQVTFNGNIALPEGATVVPIAIALTVNGEPKFTSRAIFTPAAAEDFGNVTSTAIVKVPKGCCFTVSVEHVVADEDPATTPATAIDVQNANLVISRIA